MHKLKTDTLSIMQKSSARIRGLLASLICMTGILFSANAQTVSVRGNVQDASGSAMAGVTVMVEGTTNGTMTDEAGNYQLNVSFEEGAQLLFSCLGYNDVLVPLTRGRVEYNAVLEDSAELLDDVVVVAYGTQKKANLTGAVSAMKVDDVADIPVTNTASLLQGRMSGVTVSNFSSQPGKDDDVEIRIRGIGTFGDSNPLILIDGVEGNLNSVPAEDIESISVLKDAASASIYGVRAANGVILITTKKGDKGGKALTYSGSYGVQQATVLPKFVDSWQWATLFNEENSVLGDITKNYTDEMIQKMKDGSDPDHFANTNWMEEIFRTAAIQKHYLSLTGGGKDSHFMASLGYVGQDGIMKGTDAQRANFRLNADSRFLDIITVGLNTAGSYQISTEPSAGVWNIFNTAANKTRPTIPTYYKSGEYGAFDGNPNFSSYTETPLFAVARPANTVSYKFDGKAFVAVEPVKNLKIQSSFAYQIYSDKYSNDMFTYKFYTAEGNYTEAGIPTLQESTTLNQQWVQENTISYNFDIRNSHNFSFLLGESTQWNGIKYDQAEGQGFLSDAVHVMNAAKVTSARGYEAYATLRSLFGRINYNYKNRYLLEANLRRDESSRIPAKNRTGYFPSFSAGWNIAEENFMKDQNVVDVLKLRGSWGKLGNQEIGFYPYAATYSVGDSNYIWGDEKMNGSAITSAANEDITWEVTTTTDFGIDASFLKGKINFTADWFYKLSSDILLQLPISAIVGVEEAPYVNAASVSNKGWEMNLGYNDNFGDFFFSANLNLSHVTNNIIDVNGREDWVDGWTINRAGSPIGAYYGYVAEGLYKSQEEIDAIPVKIGTPHIGDIKYADVNEDGEITDADRTIIGNPFPKFSYGLNLSAAYKGFDLNLFFQGVSGIQRVYLDVPTVEGGVTEAKMDRFHAENNPNGSFPAMGNQAYNQVPSSFWLKDASYLRLKNFELGYTIPERVLYKAGIKGIRVYVSGQNLFTCTKVVNFDPEKVATDTNNATYPNARTISAGINIKL